MVFGRKHGIQIKSPAQIQKMRVAGLVVGRTLATLNEQVRAGVSTYDLDQIARECIKAEGAISSFLGYHGYPAVICASINDEVVHGIPSKDRVLKDGDIISIDFGVHVDGWHGDSAITCFVGEVSAEARALSDVTERSMWAGLAQAVAGNHLSDIGHHVEKVINRDGKWGIVRDYGGHGIGTAMHMEPHILNFGQAGNGPVLEVGMSLAIEPMVTAGKHHVEVLDDDWTVTTRDGALASHWEHTVAITEEGPWVLTALDGGVAKLRELGLDVPDRD